MTVFSSAKNTFKIQQILTTYMDILQINIFDQI